MTISSTASRADLLARKSEINSELRATRAKLDKPASTITPAEAGRVDQLVSERDLIEVEIERLGERDSVRPAYDQVARVGAAERQYRADDVRTGRPGFFRDLAAAQVSHDPSAGARLARHMSEVEVDRPGITDRAIGSGAVAGLVPPAYLAEMFAELPRPGRPVADACAKLPLPAEGMTVNLSRITTGTSAGVQATENTAVSETNIDDTLLTVPVVTVAGQQTPSRQALERGALVESVLMGDLLNAHDSALDAQIINGSGASGQHLGILQTSGVNTVSYTDASPTVGELWPKLVDAARQVAAGRYTGATHTILSPLLWGWMLAALDSTGRPLFNVGGAQSVQNALGAVSGNAYQDQGSLFLTNLLQSGGVPSNLGAGTNETRVITADFRDVYLWEDPNAPVFIRAEQPAAASLGVLFVCYGYSAFTAGRQPKAVSVVSGTGLIPQAL